MNWRIEEIIVFFMISPPLLVSIFSITRIFEVSSSPLSNNRVHFHSDGAPECANIHQHNNEIYSPPILSGYWLANEGSTGMHRRGGGSVNCTRTCCRAYSGTRTTLVETRKNPREHNLLYRENDPFEHVSASTSRGMKNFFFFNRNKDANIRA